MKSYDVPHYGALLHEYLSECDFLDCRYGVYHKIGIRISPGVSRQTVLYQELWMMGSLGAM